MENILSDTCNQSSRQVPYCMFHCCDMDLEHMDFYWLQVNKMRDYSESDQLLRVLSSSTKIENRNIWPVRTERAFFGISKYSNFRNLLPEFLLFKHIYIFIHVRPSSKGSSNRLHIGNNWFSENFRTSWKVLHGMVEWRAPRLFTLPIVPYLGKGFC